MQVSAIQRSDQVSQLKAEHGPVCAHCADTRVIFQTLLDRRGRQEYSITNYFCIGKCYPNRSPFRRVLLCVTGREGRRTMIQE